MVSIGHKGVERQRMYTKIWVCLFARKVNKGPDDEREPVQGAHAITWGCHAVANDLSCTQT